MLLILFNYLYFYHLQYTDILKALEIIRTPNKSTKMNKTLITNQFLFEFRLTYEVF